MGTWQRAHTTLNAYKIVPLISLNNYHGNIIDLYPHAYHEGLPLELKNNRDIVFKSLLKYGYVINPLEYWHAEYRGPMSVEQLGLPVLYQVVKNPPTSKYSVADIDNNLDRK
jgi:hypothetical protein